jgi:hypothetical protein
MVHGPFHFRLLQVKWKFRNCDPGKKQKTYICTAMWKTSQVIVGRCAGKHTYVGVRGELLLSPHGVGG